MFKSNLFTEEQIQYVMDNVLNHETTICPQLDAKLFLNTISGWTKEQRELTLGLLHDMSLETSRFYYECMSTLPSYNNPADFTSYKIGE